MKKCIVEFVAKCPNCQQVKVEHQRPGGMAQDIELPKWKWKIINMDFVTGLPRSRRISKRIGNVAYELELPQELTTVDAVFHISMLKKCMGDPSLIIPTEDTSIKYSLSYEEILV
ncbi:hypothetical protein MTR67_039999 [Solanum verrucosum]|uniref:Tf2-1-like SH3-like domain-containing protein n=1 Tax=Solanum verrucosum TaxID=315347 RepID=A0AAF0UIR5_SOLVR|nr:hypothetical protein MTR67_039999 [Solanum verrucosum]